LGYSGGNFNNEEIMMLTTLAAQVMNHPPSV